MLRFIVDYVTPTLAQQKGSIRLANVSGRLVVENAFGKGKNFEHVLRFTARISSQGNPHLGCSGYQGREGWVDAHMPVTAETRQWLTAVVFANTVVAELARTYLKKEATA